MIGDNLYAYEGTSTLVFVWSKTGIFQFSINITPFPNPEVEVAGASGAVRGLSNNGTHLFVNNHLFQGNGADVGIFDANGVYQNINITLSGFSNRSTTNMEFTPSGDIVAIGGDGNLTTRLHAFLLRYNSSGQLQESINFSIIPINSLFPYGLEYVEATNELAILPRFETATFANPETVIFLDAGIVGILPPAPPALSIAEVREELPLENAVNIVGMIFLLLLIIFFIFGRGKFK